MRFTISQERVARPVRFPAPLEQAAGQARDAAIEFEFEQLRVEVGGAHAGARAERVERGRLVAKRLEQGRILAFVGACLDWPFHLPLQLTGDVVGRFDELGTLFDQRVATS